MRVKNFCFNLCKSRDRFYLIPTIIILYCRDYPTEKIEIYSLSICFLKYELVLFYKLPF